MIVKTLQTKTAQLINGVNSDYNDQLSRSGMHSLIAVPICLDQRVIGVIKLGHPDSNAFDEKDQMALEALAAQAAIAIQNAQRFEDLKRIKGFIGSKTAVDWIQMVSTVWGHSIRREVGTALGHTKLLEGILQDHKAPREATVELNYLEEIVRNIGSIPITAPLSSDDAVDSIRINELLDTYLRRQWQHSQYKAIDLELILQKDLDNKITIRASKEWLWHFFKILVDNSVQAMLKTDGANKRLIVTTQLVEKTVEIQIQDTGPGIPNPIVKKIFEEPIDKPVGSRGVGIGLVLARTIIETYEGTVRLSSTNKRGTTMKVTLPVENREQ
jgi:K+-sensing histidine kinase KdpD